MKKDLEQTARNWQHLDLNWSLRVSDSFLLLFGVCFCLMLGSKPKNSNMQVLYHGAALQDPRPRSWGCFCFFLTFLKFTFCEHISVCTCARLCACAEIRGQLAGGGTLYHVALGITLRSPGLVVSYLYPLSHLALGPVSPFLIVMLSWHPESQGSRS